jgi:PAS domain S-box-containing protein
MIPDGQPHSEDANEEVTGLIRRLHETEQRLWELTGGEVDAVMHPAGYSYLLHQAQGQLRDSEAVQRQLAARQSAILNALPAHIALLDKRGVIVSMNDAWRGFAGDNCLQQAHYGVGQNYVDLCENAVGRGSGDAHKAAAGIRSVSGGAARNFALDYPCHKATEQHWFRMLVSPLQDGSSTGVVVAHIDITERKLIEAGVRQHAARLAALVKAQHELAAIAADSEQIMDRATEIAQRLTDADGADFEVIDRDELVYRAMSGISVGQSGLRLNRNSSLSGEAIRRNLTLRCDDAEADSRVNAAACREAGLRSMIVAVLRSKGEPVGVIKVVARKPNSFGDNDAHILELFAESLGTILQRKQAEDELRLRAIQQAAIAELGQEALRSIGSSNLMEKAVAIVARTFGVEYSSVLQSLPDGISIKVVAGFGWRPGTEVKALLPAGRKSVSGYTLLSKGPIILDDLATDARFQGSRLFHRDGIVSGVSVVIRGENGPWGSLGAFTTRHRAFTPDDIVFVQSIADLIAEANRRQRVEDAMAQQAALLDKAHDAIIVRGLDHCILFWNSGAERLYGWTRSEAIGYLKHEQLYHDAADYHEANEQVFELGEWGGIIRQRRKDGSNLTVQAHWTLIRDGSGKPQSVFSIVTDITQQLALEQQLKQSQRLEAVGELTGGIAHDFNNLLTIIQGNSELLVEDLADNEQLRRMAEMTLRAAKRGAELTHRLLAFARRQHLKPKVVDANDLLSGMESLLRRTLSEDIDIELVRGANLWLSLVDPSQLEGAVLNLCINARDAMQGGGRFIIETANTQLDEDYAVPHADLISGEYVMVAVSDTGMGISPENLDRVFDPFFTTKDVGNGTGLSMVYGFIKQSRGHIEIYSEVGKGTTVKMFLPKSEQARHVVDETPASIADLGGTEKILLVEDDELVRHHAERQLIALGYLVTTAVNGPAALETIKLRADIDLLFTDVVMPGGMNGPILADQALKLRPHLKVLYTSGYTENAMVHLGRLDNGTLLLTKPYSRIELAQKVRAALAAHPRNFLE